MFHIDTTWHMKVLKVEEWTDDERNLRYRWGDNRKFGLSHPSDGKSMYPDVYYPWARRKTFIFRLKPKTDWCEEISGSVNVIVELPAYATAECCHRHQLVASYVRDDIEAMFGNKYVIGDTLDWHPGQYHGLRLKFLRYHPRKISIVYNGRRPKKLRKDVIAKSKELLLLGTPIGFQPVWVDIARDEGIALRQYIVKDIAGNEGYAMRECISKNLCT